MSDQQKDNKEEPALVPWTEFLASVPPCQLRRAIDMFVWHLEWYELTIPPIEIYCDSKKCGGVRFFDSQDGSNRISTTDWSSRFLSYNCRHCKETSKTYALHLRAVKDTVGLAVKVGEWPQFGPHIPSRMFSLLGTDQEIFHKGRRAEAQGMGIGAFAYYRRVVENQKNRLIDEIIKVSKLLNADSAIVANLEAARKETQFHKAVQIVKDGIPDVLRISGHNPLTLLHAALSDGLHDQSDEECLTRAETIRLVLAELSERIAEALKDHKELNQAVSKLLQIQSGSAQSKPEAGGAKQKPAATSGAAPAPPPASPSGPS